MYVQYNGYSQKKKKKKMKKLQLNKLTKILREYKPLAKCSTNEKIERQKGKEKHFFLVCFTIFNLAEKVVKSDM